MGLRKQYETIASAPNEFELSSIHAAPPLYREYIYLMITNLALIAAIVLFSSLSNLLYQPTFWWLILVSQLVVTMGGLRIYFLRPFKNRKLSFTEKGIVIAPTCFLGLVPLQSTVAVKWENIRTFCVIPVSFVFKSPFHHNCPWTLHVNVKNGPPLVNSQGISLFTSYGFHFEDAMRSKIIEIFDNHSIPYNHSYADRILK